MPPKPGPPPRHTEIVDSALRVLGVRRLLLAIHDVSFPCDDDEDVGRGSPGTRAADRFLGFARALGFTGLQLGPQGQTSIDNASPYDGTAFSRNVGSLPLRALARDGAFGGLVSDEALARAALRPAGGPAQHRRAHATLHALVAQAFAAFAAGARPDLAAPLARFRREQADWLAPDALYAALRAGYADVSARDWKALGADPLDEMLFDPPPGAAAAAAARRAALETVHQRSLDAYSFAQLMLHDQHADLRRRAAALGLALYGDLQVGLSDGDVWARRAVLRRDYLVGAPPSRTNPEGQPWGYPVLDPAQYGDGTGPAVALLVARADKAFAEYDSMRIDHPHGLVCPWVYAAGAADPGRAVREGARLFESPDLPDHPALAPLAIVAPAQLDRSQPRHADGWVTDLTPAQVARYAILFDALVSTAQRRGADPASIVCEILSTLPLPLARVLARHRLGRFRVTQKANLDDATDVYRTENARPEDWVMLGTHDTPPLFELVHTLGHAGRARWARHLAARLRLAPDEEAALRAEPGRLAQAMLAELFACAAENVSIFFADLFGGRERYNVPGTVAESNWALRLPASFAELYADRVARREALDLPAALALAVAARGPEHAPLVAALRGLSAAPGAGA